MRPLILFTLVLASCACPAQHPNVVLLITDDQGFGDFGATGNRLIETPRIDELAARSVYFNTFYVSPVCSPTRASLMTGRYNYRTRVVDTYAGRSMMEPDEVTLAEALRAGGYATGLFGKWHLGDSYPMRPQDQGFDEVLMHRGGGLAQPSEPPENGRRYTNPILYHNGVETLTQGYCTDVYFDHAIDFIDASAEADRPFFAYVATNAPHGPFHDVPDELLERYQRKDLSPLVVGDLGPEKLKEELDTVARVAAMITNIDQNLGRLVAHLREAGQLENTLIAVMVDNGPNTRRYVGPFRGKKCEVHEGGVRSPLWLHWPAGLGEPRTIETPVAHIDLMPTLLDLCGVERPSVAFDGRSLAPLLSDPSADWPEREIVIQSHRGERPKPRTHFMIRDARWKLLHASGFDGRIEGESRMELYDLTNDPGETNDLVSQRPEIEQRLLEAYDRWFEEVSSTRPDNYDAPRLVVGSSKENPVTLTRQDWRGAAGWSPQHVGHWMLRVVDEGPYAVRILRKDFNAEQTLNLTAGTTTRLAVAPVGKQQVSLDEVRLPKGPVKLEVEFTSGDHVHGAYQVILERQ